MKLLSAILFLFVGFSSMSQTTSHIKPFGLYCADLENNNRWCFNFDSTGKVEAILSGKIPRSLFEGFLPSGFTDTYKVVGDTLKFMCYSEEYGAENFPAPYRYNYFTLYPKGEQFEILIDGYTAGGTIRQIKLLLSKTAVKKKN